VSVQNRAASIMRSVAPMLTASLALCSSVYAAGEAREYWNAPGSFYALGGAEREGSALKLKEPVGFGSVLFIQNLCWGSVKLAADPADQVGFSVVPPKLGGGLMPAQVSEGQLSYELAKLTFGDSGRQVRSIESPVPLVLVHEKECVCIYGWFRRSETETVAVHALYEDVTEGTLNLQQPDAWLVLAYKGMPFRPESVVLSDEEIPPLLKMLQSKAVLARTYAAHALAGGGKPSVDALIGALRDSSTGVRCNAAMALAVIGDRRAADPLSEALSKETEEGVRTAIKQSLEKLAAK